MIIGANVVFAQSISIDGAFQISDNVKVTEVCDGNTYYFTATLSGINECGKCPFLTEITSDCISYYEWYYKQDNKWFFSKGTNKFSLKMNAIITEIKCRAFIDKVGLFNAYTSFSNVIPLTKTNKGNITSVELRDMNLVDIKTTKIDERIFNANDTLYIRQNAQGNPIMPNIQVKFNGQCGSIEGKFKLEMSYSRQTNGAFNPYNPQTTRFPEDVNSLFITTISKPVTIPYNGKFRGGDATLTYQYINSSNTLVSQTIPFKIYGLNPTTIQVNNYTDNCAECSNYWFMKKIFTHETQRCQYRDKGRCSNWPASRVFRPLFGFPDGQGIGQLDNGITGGVGTNEYATEQMLWNWQENVKTACSNIIVGKINAVRNSLRNMLKFIRITHGHYDISQIQSNLTYNDVTFTHAKSPLIQFTTQEDIKNYNEFFPNDPPAGQYSFLDANIIKAYNGVSGCSTNSNFYHYILNANTWQFCTTRAGNGQNYVNLVCNENP